MAQLTQIQAAERTIRELVENTDLPAPDEVEYGEDSVTLLWHARKLAVVIEGGEPLPDAPPPPQASSPRGGGRI